MKSFVFFSVSQTPSVNEETTPQQISSTSQPTANKPNTSPVNTTVSPSNVTQPKQSPVQSQNNENASTPSRNQLNPTGPNAWGAVSEDQIYAKSPLEPHHPRGWLVDLINRYVSNGCNLTLFFMKPTNIF